MGDGVATAIPIHNSSNLDLIWFWEVYLAMFVSNKVTNIVMGDPGRFRQIVTNLVGKFVKLSDIFKLNLSYVMCICITNIHVVLEISF